MKAAHFLLTALLLIGETTQAAVYTSGTLNTIIPDGNAVGISSTINVSGFGGALGDLSVYINLSGGANGDLYAYLSHEGGSVVLLNRIGNTSANPFGSSAAGLGSSSGGWYDFRLNDAGATDIHDYSASGPLTGTYQPDRRTADPQVVLDSSYRGSSLVSFNGSNPNGDWTIFFADMAGGGGASPGSLLSWGLEVTGVPEPVNSALGILAGIFLAVMAARSRWTRCRVRRWRAAFVVWVNAV